MLDWIYSLFGWLIKLFYNAGNNYFVALILFAVFVKILLLPFSIKQQKNSIRQAKLRPKEMAIRKRYAGRNDKPSQQKLNEDIMNLYQEENFNPMSGCLPLLLQFPILICIYQAVIRPLEFFCGISKDLVKEGGAVFEFVKNINADAIKSQIEMANVIKTNFGAFMSTDGLSAATGISSEAQLPNFSLFGWDLSVKPSLAVNWYLIIPILTFVFMFFGMKITRKFTYNPQVGTGGDAQKSMAIMDWTMPLFSVYISFIMPSVIGIYWIFQNILGTVQQIILAKVMPIPSFTEEEYKIAEKQMNGKYKPEKKKSDKKVRSLHHIDDDEFEEIYGKGKKGKPADNKPDTDKPAEEEKPEPKDEGGLKGLIDKPEMKE